MSTLFLLNGLQVGGTETKSVKIVNEMVARGRSVNLAYLQGPEHLLSEISDSVKTTCLKRRGKFSWNALNNLRRCVISDDIEMIVCMNEYPLLYAAILKLFFGFNELKVVLAINTTDFKRFRDRLFMLVYSRMIRKMDGVIYGCDYQRQLWQARYHLTGVESRVIYNGVDTKYFNSLQPKEDFRDKLNLGDSFVIGCVGRLDQEKNQIALLKAAAELNIDEKRCDVLLIGSGPKVNQLRRKAAFLGIEDRVHFLGRMKDVRGALRAMDVFVLPSIAVETFSNAALEAMAMSLPVVLSDIAGAREMVIDKQDGYVYRKDDLEGLVNLLKSLRNDVVLRERIGMNARNSVVRKYSTNQMYDAYDRLLSAQ